MATRTPGAVFLDENLPIHRCNGAEGAKAKPLKPRKALRDVSNTGKPPVSSILKGSALKEKSTLRIPEPRKNLVKTDDEKCREWAKEGVEHCYFTGNDVQQNEKDRLEKRVKKKVEKIISALDSWSDLIFDPLLFPAKAVAKFSEELKGLEFEPEILPDYSSSAGDKPKHAPDPLAEDEIDLFQFVENKPPVQFRLKDESIDDGEASRGVEGL